MAVQLEVWSVGRQGIFTGCKSDKSMLKVNEGVEKFRESREMSLSARCRQRSVPDMLYPRWVLVDRLIGSGDHHSVKRDVSIEREDQETRRDEEGMLKFAAKPMSIACSESCPMD
jgi:hypothetical protein